MSSPAENNSDHTDHDCTTQAKLQHESGLLLQQVLRVLQLGSSVACLCQLIFQNLTLLLQRCCTLALSFKLAPHLSNLTIFCGLVLYFDQLCLQLRNLHVLPRIFCADLLSVGLDARALSCRCLLSVGLDARLLSCRCLLSVGLDARLLSCCLGLDARQALSCRCLLRFKPPLLGCASAKQLAHCQCE